MIDRAAMSHAEEPLLYRAPHPVDVTPTEYQHAAVEYALTCRHTLIGDEPGLGKTAEAIMISNAAEATDTLVICPASLVLNWCREIEAWTTIENPIIYPTLSAKRDGVSPEANYSVMSYNMLMNPHIYEAVMQYRYDHLILDECHYLKDEKGNKRTARILPEGALSSAVGRITALSGTPLPNQPMEVYNMIRLLNWDAIHRMSPYAFREYFYALGGGFVRKQVEVEFLDEHGHPIVYTKSKLVWDDEIRNQPRRMDELQGILRKSLMVRRLKSNVLDQLPDKQWHVFPIERKGAVAAALNHPGWKKAEALYEMDPEHFSGGAAIDGAISTARRLLGEAKAPIVAAYIDDLFRSGITKLVVGAHHKTVLTYFHAYLAKKYHIAIMEGSMKKRQIAVDQFQDDPEVQIIIGQNQVLSLGHTLHAAQDVVCVEPDWVPGNNDQLLERVHRYGQTGSYVIGHVPAVPGTMDENILGTTIRKARNIYAALDERH